MTHYVFFTVAYLHRIWTTGMTSGPYLTHPIPGLDTTKGLVAVLNRWAEALAHGRCIRIRVIAANRLSAPAKHAWVWLKFLSKHGKIQTWAAMVHKHQVIRKVTVRV